MSLDTVLLFVHVLGAMGYSAATLLSLFGILVVRRSQRVEQARPLLGLMEVAGPVSGISLLLIVAAGLAMTATAWGWQTGWIDVTLGSMLVLLIPTGAVMGIRRHTAARLASEMPNGPLPEALAQRINDPLLGAAMVVQVALLLGIIFLMTVQPGMVGSLIVIGVALILGLAFSLPFWRKMQHERKTVNQV